MLGGGKDAEKKECTWSYLFRVKDASKGMAAAHP